MASAQKTDLGSEFDAIDLGDARLDRRSRKMLGDLAAHPGQSFPKVWPDDSELEAAYRFFGNVKAKPKLLIDAHAERTAERARALGCPVLVAHDTTEARIPLYFEDLMRDGLGKKSSRQQGFDAHVSFAIGLDAHAQPLGTLAVQAFVGKDEISNDKAREFWSQYGGLYANEMQRWRDGIMRSAELLIDCGHKVIHTGDRELGRYAMLAWMQEMDQEFVVRAALDQLAAGRKPRLSLTDALADAEWSGKVTANIARRSESRSAKSKKSHPSRQARKVELSFRAKAVDLYRAKHKDSDAAYNPLGELLPDNIEVNVVEVLERNPPPGETAVHWVLVTSLPVATFAEQLFVVTCYRRRWMIEEFFRALKQGCRFEQRQLESAAALLVALAMLLPVAWHLMRLQAAADHLPDTPWRKLFGTAVVTAVRRLMPKLALPVTATVQQIYLAIAKLGGHLKRNGPPGWQTLTKGLAEVIAALKGMGAKAFFQVAINP